MNNDTFHLLCFQLREVVALSSPLELTPSRSPHLNSTMLEPIQTPSRPQETSRKKQTKIHRNNAIEEGPSPPSTRRIVNNEWRRRDAEIQHVGDLPIPVTRPMLLLSIPPFPPST